MSTFYLWREIYLEIVGWLEPIIVSEAINFLANSVLCSSITQYKLSIWLAGQGYVSQSPCS